VVRTIGLGAILGSPLLSLADLDVGSFRFEEDNRDVAGFFFEVSPLGGALLPHLPTLITV